MTLPSHRRLFRITTRSKQLISIELINLFKLHWRLCCHSNNRNKRNSQISSSINTDNIRISANEYANRKIHRWYIQFYQFKDLLLCDKLTLPRNHIDSHMRPSVSMFKSNTIRTVTLIVSGHSQFEYRSDSGKTILFSLGLIKFQLIQRGKPLHISIGWRFSQIFD